MSLTVWTGPAALCGQAPSPWFRALGLGLGFDLRCIFGGIPEYRDHARKALP